MSERKSVDTRERVLEVAETLFAQKGYAGAHLQAIATDVGVQKTALYYYFDSKEALYIAVVSAMLADFDRCVTTAISRETDHPTRLCSFLDDLNDLLADRPNYSQILLRLFVDRAGVDLSPLTPTISGVVSRTLTFYREGVEDGCFRKVSSRHFFQTALGAIVFHYAAGDFAAQVIGVDGIFKASAVSWRRSEVRTALLEGVLVERPRDPGTDPAQS